jgi:hypothetical protein
MLQGSKTPSNGMLGLAPGMMGFSVFGEMKIDLKGADKEFFIQTEAGLGYGKIDLVKLTPKLLSKLGVKPELDPMPLGRFYHIDDYFFDKQNYPTEKAVVNGGSGEVGMKVTPALFRHLARFPKWVGFCWL